MSKEINNNNSNNNNHDSIAFYTVFKQDANTRLDKWLLRMFSNLNNSIVQKLIRTGQVRVNSKRHKFNQVLSLGDIVRVPLHIIKNFEGNNIFKPQKDTNRYKKEIDYILQNIIYKDKDFIAINKPAGLSVQGGSKVGFNLSYAFEALSFEEDSLPHIVHRIDKDTSGVLLMARHKIASQYLSELFKNKKIQKVYNCLVYPYNKSIAQEGTINAPLEKKGNYNDQKIVVSSSGKEAITNYKVQDINKDTNIANLLVSPITGRTHQIRVHLSEVFKMPILGDYKYGFRDNQANVASKRLYLHASELSFQTEDGRNITIKAELDDSFKAMLQQLNFSN